MSLIVRNRKGDQVDPGKEQLKETLQENAELDLKLIVKESEDVGVHPDLIVIRDREVGCPMMTSKPALEMKEVGG